MNTSNIVPIGIQHGPAISKERDRLHGQYQAQARGAIMHALATRGTAVGPLDYERPAAAAIVEDMIFSDAAISLLLIDLAQDYARNMPIELIGARAVAMLNACVQFSANKMADDQDADKAVADFTPGDANG